MKINFDHLANEKVKEKYGSLYEGLKLDSFVKVSFNVILYFRKLLFSMFIMTLYDATYVQLSLVIILNLILIFLYIT